MLPTVCVRALVASRAQAMRQMFPRGETASSAGGMLARPGRDLRVMTAVRLWRQYAEILRSVIERVAIDVMHMFAATQRTTNLLRHDDAMFIRPLAARGCFDQTIHNTTPRIVQSRATEWALMGQSCPFQIFASGHIRACEPLFSQMARNAVGVALESPRGVIHQRDALFAATRTQSDFRGI